MSDYRDAWAQKSAEEVSKLKAELAEAKRDTERLNKTESMLGEINLVLATVYNSHRWENGIAAIAKILRDDILDAMKERDAAMSSQAAPEPDEH